MYHEVHHDEFNACIAARKAKDRDRKLLPELHRYAAFVMFKSGVPGFLCKP